MGWPFVRRRMSSELGHDWRDKFETFEREAAHAASLGQVHRATTAAGQLLACKLQYPDMSSAVEADLKQLRLGRIQITDAGVYELQRVLANCEIESNPTK